LLAHSISVILSALNNPTINLKSRLTTDQVILRMRDERRGVIENQINRQNFEALLVWLDPTDRDRAANIYEQIRRRLIKIFAYRGALVPEELADLTIDRVAAKINEIGKIYRGDPAAYFLRVAQLVYHEENRRVKRKQTALADYRWRAGSFGQASAAEEAERTEARAACLEQCLGELDPGLRALVSDYYADDKTPKTERRLELTEKHKIDLNSLRVRVFRARRALQQCIENCLAARAG
jgi:DNA-directed RNA polymerase specialized sigma24 family protein